MKPRDMFCAILKAIGVMFWGYAVEGLPSAIRYTPYFYKVDETVKGMQESFNSYWQLGLTRSLIYLVLGCLLVFGTSLFARLAYGPEREIQISN
jgi:hypothetical protein